MYIWTFNSLCHMNIQRNIKDEVLATAREFKAICITGPRQSGKTTLAKMLFPKKKYVSLEDPDTALAASENTRAFLKQFPDGAILDEAHRVPQIFNYLQGILDNNKKRNQFVITGSNNFLMHHAISQTLAGRVGYIELLPLSYNEIVTSRKKSFSLEEIIFRGGYPGLYKAGVTPARWMPNYIKTYIERDVRLLRNIGDLRTFQKFLKLCADRAGQILNTQNLAVETGVDIKTAQAWLSVMEGSYIIFMLTPYFKNFSKRVIKTPKLYFYDTGLLCYLLGIKSETALAHYHKRGALFENFVVSEIKKNRLNAGNADSLHYFRDSNGNEVDLLLEKDEHLIPVEIKSSAKFDVHALKGIKWWQRFTHTDGGILIYNGATKSADDAHSKIMSWRSINAEV